MHVLLTNDDGIDAPGLRCLMQAAGLMGATRISVVAPAREHSMCGHRVTTHSALRLRERQTGVWALEGTPADCVRVALYALGLEPDWVLSGVNAGGNLGQDLMISGTCAAAREAAYHGRRAMALSHYLRRGLEVDWSRTAQWAAALWNEIAPRPQPDGQWWCVNFPHHPVGEMSIPEWQEVQPARRPLPVDFVAVQDGLLYRGDYSARPRDPGSDVEACFEGRISVVRSHV